MLNLKHLYYFHVFSKDLSTCRAAKRLGISAPALSNQLKQLEEFLGIPLTRRTGGIVTITEQGEIVLQYTSQMFSAYAMLKSKISFSKDQRNSQLRVGASHNLGPQFVIDLLSLVEKASMAASKSILIIFDSSENLVEGLNESKFDLIIGGFSSSATDDARWNFQTIEFPIRLFSSFGVIERCDLGKRPLTKIGLAEMIDHANSKGISMVLPQRSSKLREETDKVLAKLEIKPVRTIECNCSGGIVQLIERGLAYGLIPTPSMLDFKSAKALAVAGPTEGFWAHSVSILMPKGEELPLANSPTQLADFFAPTASIV